MRTRPTRTVVVIATVGCLGWITGCGPGSGKIEAVDPEVAACQQWGDALLMDGFELLDQATAASIGAPDPVGTLMRTVVAGMPSGDVTLKDLQGIVHRCAEIGVRIEGLPAG